MSLDSRSEEHSDPTVVRTWYDRKTASILKKYGPGPRVHFHIGLFDRPQRPEGKDMDTLRHLLVASQEALLARAAEVWEAPRCLSGAVVDAGCGLGGGAIYWAQEYGALVTAVTIVPSHINMIAALARQAGVSTRVRPLLADACGVPGTRCFDAAVSMEAACYFPRQKWFAHLARLLRPGGYVCVEDTFLRKPQWREPFDHYWRTSIAPLEEYLEAAERAGFWLDRHMDITELTTEFWVYSQAWIQACLTTAVSDETERQRLQHSLKWHRQFYQAWQEHGIEVRLLRFQLLA